MHYHVLNRGNQRARVFHDDDDYATFIRLLVRACERFQMRVQALAVLPNHFHAILLPKADGDLSRFMQMLTARQAEHDRVKRGTTGHLWQGRFRSFPIQSDRYLLAATAYVERNPVRAGLVTRAEDWPWSSAYLIGRSEQPSWLIPPLEAPATWLARLNESSDFESVRALRTCINAGRPFGSPRWVAKTCARHSLPAELRPRGRQPPAKPGV